jgi:uncharacterized membrane protein
MGDQTVVLAIATYASQAAAEKDFHAVHSVKHDGDVDHVAAAVVEKSADGKLEIDRHDSTAKHHGWEGALLGGAITVVAAPLGIQFLAPVVSTGAEWAGVAAIVGHFWYNIPKDQLRRMSNLLEADQAALVVAAVDHSREDIASLLSNATNKVVADDTQADFEADFAKAIQEATVQG